MGALLVVASATPPAQRAATIEVMAQRSPHRGKLRFVHAHGISIAVQARAGEASLHDDAGCIVAVHGRAYDIDSTPKPETERTSARTVADAWIAHGQEALARLDGEYALCILDKRTGATYLCVSLMMTKPLYLARNADTLCLAPEIRQCAAGIGEPMRLDPAEVAMTYWLGGAVLNRQRTEFQGIDRLLSPQIYRIPANSTALAELGTYYAPPPCLPEQAFANSTRAAEDLIAALQPPLQGLSERTALAFSAGHDSGLMYILARTRPELGLRPPLYGMTHPGSMNDERPGMEALASHFGDAVRFVDAPKVSFEEAMELNLRTADGIVPVSTVAGGVKLARRLVADGGTHCLTGMGAEAALQVFPTYLLDLLRQGRVVAFLRDALRFRPYLTGGAGLPHRLRHLARALLAPKDSVLGRARERRRVGAAGERWQAMLAEGLDAFISIRRDETYGRTVRLMQLRFHSLMSGTEQAEQLFESHGVSLVQPYAHRQVMDVGLRIPARTLSGGRYDKYLQRSAATLLLGHDPGWPWHKTSAAAVNEPISGASIEALGPPPGWRLVELEILTLEAAREITRNPGTWAALSHLLNHESYLRHYGA